jgi:SAM-dependent methyltransferase
LRSPYSVSALAIPFVCIPAIVSPRAGGGFASPMMRAPWRVSMLGSQVDSLSYDSMVGLYDQTRTTNRACFTSALDHLCSRFPPSVFGRLFEPGIGTGRIALPLAHRGYRVTGADISTAMMTRLRERFAESGAKLEPGTSIADVTALPFRDGAFDISIVVHLFYFIPDWRQAAHEIIRVTRRDGPIVLMHTGMGEEVPFLNTRYKQRCARLGYPIPTIGVASTAEVITYLKTLGCQIEIVSDRWCWTSLIGLSAAIGHMQSRAYSFTTCVPEPIHVAAISALKAECESEYGGLARQVEVPNQVRLAIVRQ